MFDDVFDSPVDSQVNDEDIFFNGSHLVSMLKKYVLGNRNIMYKHCVYFVWNIEDNRNNYCFDTRNLVPPWCVQKYLLVSQFLQYTL